MSKFGCDKSRTIRNKNKHSIEPFLRNQEVFLDLGDQNWHVQSQLTKLGCKVFTLPNDLTSATCVFISIQPLQYYARNQLLEVSPNFLRKHSRGGRAIQIMQNMKRTAFRRSTSKSSLLKAKALNPNIQFHYYPEIKARLDRESKVYHPHEYRFDFDMADIKKKYPNACQYFITDAKGVHKIEPHIVTDPPRLYLDHPCGHQGSYFAKPSRKAIKRTRKSRLDSRFKVPKKLKQRVCDGCMRRYTNLELHKKSIEHQEWYKATNFDDVDEFISMVNRKQEEKERLRREEMDRLQLTAENLQKVEQKVSLCKVKEVILKISHLAAPLKPQKREKAKFVPRSSLSTASDTSLSSDSSHRNSDTSKKSQRGFENMETGSSSDEERIYRGFWDKELTKIKCHTESTNRAFTAGGISDFPDETRSLSTHRDQVINMKQNPTLSYTLSDSQSSNQPNPKLVKEDMKRKRLEIQTISPQPKLSPQVPKVAVMSNYLCITSEQKLTNPSFEPCQSILQPIIIEALRTGEFKTKSAKRRKRKHDSEVLYRLSGTAKLNSEDKRVKLHQKLRILATKQFNRRLKSSSVRISLPISKPFTRNNSLNKPKSCLINKKELARNKPRQSGHSSRLTCSQGKLSTNISVLERSTRKSKRKRVRYTYKELTTVQQSCDKNKSVKARRSYRKKNIFKSKSRKIKTLL